MQTSSQTPAPLKPVVCCVCVDSQARISGGPPLKRQRLYIPFILLTLRGTGWKQDVITQQEVSQEAEVDVYWVTS